MWKTLQELVRQLMWVKQVAQLIAISLKPFRAITQMARPQYGAQLFQHYLAAPRVIAK